jgi:hypothetical protein
MKKTIRDLELAFQDATRSLVSKKDPDKSLVDAFKKHLELDQEKGEHEQESNHEGEWI